MNYETTLGEIKAYVERELLDGDGKDLTPMSPLLAWGVLTSLRVVKMLHFIRQRFDIDVPPDELVAHNLKDLDSITNLVLKHLTSSQRRQLDNITMTTGRSR